MKTQTDMTVAKEILNQLGGGRFITMTGASNFVGGNNFLMFMLPRAKDGINKVKVTLNSMDTYDIEFGRVRSIEYKIIDSVNGIYNEDLADVVSNHTGLTIRL